MRQVRILSYFIMTIELIYDNMNTTLNCIPPSGFCRPYQLFAETCSGRQGKEKITMARRIVEGLWDCPYCDTRAIGGLTKSCPCCGHPQDTDTRFYIGKEKKYVEEDLASQYGQGPDWVCPYCKSLNRIRFQYCAACGAPKEESEDNYFSSSEKQDAIKAEKEAKIAAMAGESSGSINSDSGSRGGGGRKPVFLIVALLAIVGILIFNLWPRHYKTEITTAAWARSTDVEALRTVQESDWTIPAGGRKTDSRLEVHHYVQVLDHYETRSRQVSEQVYDGEETYTTLSNNGDGTFTEETHSRPKYRTEYRTEYYEEPVYRSDPVFETKYYYDIDRWIVDRTEKSSAADSEPYWPELTLAENEREGQRYEVYNVVVKSEDKSYTVYLPFDWWSELKAGDKVEITVSGGKVKKLNDRTVPQQ